MTIAYQLDKNLYLNITNLCSCNCVFCIRQEHDGVGDGGNLWLEHEPSVPEIIRALEGYDLSRYGEIVFCGYGEPTERLDVMLEVCKYLRSHPAKPAIRLNTNGLADLIHKKETAPLLDGLVDTVSISLNAPTAERYLEVTQPAFGIDSFAAMLRFAEGCKRHVPHVVFSLVDVLRPGEADACRSIADSLGIPLRVRVKS